MIWGMELFNSLPWIWVLLLVLTLDMIIGDPAWLYHRIPHPVVWMGKLLTLLDRGGNRESLSDQSRKLSGILCLIVYLGIIFAISYSFNIWLAGLTSQVLSLTLLILISSVFLSCQCLLHHIKAVAIALECGDITKARQALSMVVGRDVDKLDQHAISRAAIESLSENYSDGVIAPAFWFLLAGLPGLVLYKAVNTADSMIGHKNAKYLQFGWAAARLDDVMNFIPARLTAFLIISAGFFISSASALTAYQMTIKYSAQHRSPNAGWPEAAMAGALAFKLGGPLSYGAENPQVIWLGEGEEKLTSVDLRKSLQLIYVSISISYVLLFILGVV